MLDIADEVCPNHLLRIIAFEEMLTTNQIIQYYTDTKYVGFERVGVAFENFRPDVTWSSVDLL